MSDAMLREVCNKKCLFCDDKISGNQQFMLGGKTLPNRRGTLNNWLKERPEHQWFWSGMGDIINGESVQCEFYLCPKHQSHDFKNKAYNWADKELGKLTLKGVTQ